MAEYRVNLHAIVDADDEAAAVQSVLDDVQEAAGEWYVDGAMTEFQWTLSRAEAES